MWYNKVEYSTADGVYCTTLNVKVNSCVPGFSSSKTINHRFHVNNEKDESGIGYDNFIVHDLMVHLGPTADFKRQFLQWDGATVQMEEPSSLLGQYFQLSARYARWLYRQQNQIPHEGLLNDG